MDLTVTISGDYGYVVLVICSSWFLLNWLESRTFQARRKYEIPVCVMVISASCNSSQTNYVTHKTASQKNEYHNLTYTCTVVFAHSYNSHD